MRPAAVETKAGFLQSETVCFHLFHFTHMCKLADCIIMVSITSSHFVDLDFRTDSVFLAYTLPWCESQEVFADFLPHIEKRLPNCLGLAGVPGFTYT